MQRNVQVFFTGCIIMMLSSLAQAQISTTSAAVPAGDSVSGASAQQMTVAATDAEEPSATPAASASPSPNTQAATLAAGGPANEKPATPPPTPVPSPAPKINIQIENLTPSAGALETGRMNYMRYCADCHGANGEGKKGPKLAGSLIVTGPVYGHLSIVLNGHDKTIMPTWGISEISDDVIGSVITYQRNAWGNNNKKEYGRHAGGVVSAEWVHVYRKMMKNLPVKQDVRT